VLASWFEQITKSEWPKFTDGQMTDLSLSGHSFQNFENNDVGRSQPIKFVHSTTACCASAAALFALSSALLVIDDDVAGDVTLQ
jgi:hypothetical protein